jgi:hypothetical protein
LGQEKSKENLITNDAKGKSFKKALRAIWCHCCLKCRIEEFSW